MSKTFMAILVQGSSDKTSAILQWGGTPNFRQVVLVVPALGDWDQRKIKWYQSPCIINIRKGNDIEFNNVKALIKAVYCVQSMSSS